MIYHKYLSDLEKADLRSLDKYDIFYRCFDIQSERYIERCQVYRKTKHSIWFYGVLLRRFDVECEIYLGLQNARIKTVEKNSFLNY